MDLPTAAFLGVIAILTVNQLVMRIPFLRDRLFWPAQILNAVVGLVVLGVGLPGYEAFPMVSIVVGLLFFLHIAEGMKWWAQRPDDDSAVLEEAEEEA